MKRFVIFIIAAMMIAVPGRWVSGQVSQASEELISVMLREGGQATASELTELGGEAAVSALLQRAAREGGESLVDRVVQYGSRFGPSALKAIEPSPSKTIGSLDRVPPDLIQPAIRAAARDPELTSRLVSAYGDGALELMARQPGVGTALVEKLGANGIRIGNRLTTDQAVALARHAEDIAALPSAQRNQLLDAMTKAPAQFLDFLEAHPKVLLTAGGVSAFIVAKENILGSAVPSTGYDTLSAGLVERLIFRLANKFAGPTIAGIMFTVFGIGAYMMIRLRGSRKSTPTRLKHGPTHRVPEISRPLKNRSHNSR